MNIMVISTIMLISSVTLFFVFTRVPSDDDFLDIEKFKAFGKAIAGGKK